jgi:hypothetical protein
MSISSIRVSSKLRFALLSIAAVVAIYSLLFVGLNYLALWAETTANTYPYAAGEDPIRVLLPSLMGRSGRARIMLLGPSAAEDAFLYEDFNRAFPGYHAYQASFSTATLDDVLVALEYVERAYGEDAMPDVLILGVQARFLANKPRRFGPNKDATAYSPFFNSINLYSALFRVEESEKGSVLVPKTRFESLAAGWRFWGRKQQPRHRAAIVALLNRIVNGAGSNLELVTGLPPLKDIRDPFARPTGGTALRYIASARPFTAFRSWLPAYNSPYLTHYMPTDNADTRPEGSFGIRQWDPSSEAGLVTSQVSRLRETAHRLNIKLFVVITPEHPATRALHPAIYYDSLMTLVRGALRETPVLELRTLLDDHDFFDEEHVRRNGARRVTGEVIRFIMSNGGLTR